MLRTVNEWQQAIDEGIDLGQDVIPKDIDIDLDFGTFNPPDALQAYWQQRKHWLGGGDVDQVRSRLLAGLQHVRNHPNFSHLVGKIDHASRVMTMDYGVEANYAGVEQVKQETLQYISTIKKQHQALAQQITDDYD